MPIIFPKDGELDSLYDRLHEAGATVLTHEQAEQQDIRAARIALLNLMPAASMERTEIQWLRLMSQSVLQVEPVLLNFDNDARQRAGASRAGTLDRYEPFSEVRKQGIDGLIVTGDNLELRTKGPSGRPEGLPFEEIEYARQLGEVINWAQQNVHSTIYSCLASHFALDYLFGVERDISEKKVFGVYDHAVNRTSKSPLIAGMDDVIRAPHSRWGTVPTGDLMTTPVEVLASNTAIGWLLAQASNDAGGQNVFIQGHPEYDRDDLKEEYLRDKSGAVQEPTGYYSEDGTAQLTWANDARALHANWIAGLYEHFSKTA